MAQGVIRQPAIPHLDLSGVPVVVPHVVIQAADDFRSHVLQEDVCPAFPLKILLYSFSGSLLVLHRRLSVAASDGISDVFVTPFQPGGRTVDTILLPGLLVELRRIEDPVGADGHGLEIGPLVDALSICSIVRDQIQMKVLPLAEAFLVVFHIQAPVNPFQCSFLDFDFHCQKAFAVWDSGLAAGFVKRLFTRFIVSTFFWSTIFAYTSVIWMQLCPISLLTT